MLLCSARRAHTSLTCFKYPADPTHLTCHTAHTAQAHQTTLCFSACSESHRAATRHRRPACGRDRHWLWLCRVLRRLDALTSYSPHPTSASYHRPTRVALLITHAVQHRSRLLPRLHLLLIRALNTHALKPHASSSWGTSSFWRLRCASDAAAGASSVGPRLLLLLPGWSLVAGGPSASDIMRAITPSLLSSANDVLRLLLLSSRRIPSGTSGELRL